MRDFHGVVCLVVMLAGICNMAAGATIMEDSPVPAWITWACGFIQVIASMVAANVERK